MARLELDLGPLGTQRAALRELVDAQRARDADVAAAEAALDAATRAGGNANALGPLAARLDEARTARTAAAANVRDARARVDAFADRLALQLDPARLVDSLDGAHPIALLPMRIETRYVPAGRPDRLRIRVYPDDLNTIEHTPSPTESERDAAIAYWTARWARDDAEAERVLRDLAQATSRGRAAWVVRILAPVDEMPAPGADAVAPTFPDVPTIDTRAKATRAVLLPDRWCAIGYASGRREVFRAWGRRIPDELVLSPDWLAADDPEPLFGGERAWLADFDAALANGMAIEVTQAAVARGTNFDLARGTIERLVVVGLEWTKTPAESAADLAELFAAHRDSTGFGFAPLGTPTNNTEAAPSGYSRGFERTPPAPADTTSGEQDALQLFTWAFGIAPDALPADQIVNAHLAEQRTALHMLNALWRGTFGHYLYELWNPPLDDTRRVIDSSAVYALRRYAVSYLRPSGPLPIARVGKQPYGILPMVGRRFVDPGGSAVETNVGKVLAVLRPLWELARAKVPLVVDGDVAKAKDALQTSPWSQAAFYRDKDADKMMCMKPSVFSDAQQPSRNALVERILDAVGTKNFYDVHIHSCNDFRPDPPYSPGALAGVPWVMADPKDPLSEAPGETALPAGDNYLAKIADAALNASSFGGPVLQAQQAGPALLQALAAYSVLEESGDAVKDVAISSAAVARVVSLATTRMPHVEAMPETEATFTIQTPKELASVVIPATTGRATIGEFVASAMTARPIVATPAPATVAASRLFDSVALLTRPTRNLGAVKLSLDYLAGRPVGELNVAFRTTLDAFSYRLDAWITARANRRLEQMRSTNATGVHVGGYAFVENLKADRRPDSEGHVLAPSLAQAASASLLRSGFMANHEQGAFDIALDSRRTRRALDVLQGLGRDQPLAALYGYRIERGLRDALLGRLIWPLRLAFPWRPAGAEPDDEPKEAVGARDVVDGVALLEAWTKNPADVSARLATALANLESPAPAPSGPEWATVGTVVADALDLADSVADLLMAEGMHQIVRGNLDRAAAAMAVVDKQSLPIEPQVHETPRGGASYTQRLAVICPSGAPGWPEDRRALAEPAVNGWLAAMLGDPARYRFTAQARRGTGDDGQPALDDPITIGLDALGLSPLSAVLAATTPGTGMLSRDETGFRATLVRAFVAALDDPGAVTGLDVLPTAAAAGGLGLAEFEAFALALKTLVDKSRPLTRRELARHDDALEPATSDDGDWPGADLAEIEGRAETLAVDFGSVLDAIVASVDADGLLAALADASDFVPPATWPPQVVAIDATEANPTTTREDRADAARAALALVVAARKNDVAAPPELTKDQVAPTSAQRVKHAIDRIRLMLGKDFPVLPRCALGPYAAEFGASLDAQDALTVADPWRITGWLAQVARVRDGADRFATTLSAHETLCAMADANDFRVVQFPHRPAAVWAALPEAWLDDGGAPFDPKAVPEELHAFLGDEEAGFPVKDIQRVAPDVAIALHVPGGLDAPTADTTLAGFVCDDWPEFVPDRFQTAGIGFHYDAPGARPPQSILLALPPRLGQDAWSFDDLMDVIHETFDLAKLRGVRPRDLGSGLGALLPGSYLPHAYTDDLPSVQVLKMQRDARAKLVQSATVDRSTVPLGKL